MSSFFDKVVSDVGSAMSAALVVLGDQLGLWGALAEKPMTSTELARRTETHERYIREWLNAMAAGGYVMYGKDTETYWLEPEAEAALADFAGLFQMTAAMWAAEPKIAANFRSGAGLPWSHQHPALFEGTERFLRAGYAGNLVSSWLPALDGVVERLEQGARIADVGCGVGASTIIMAEAFPRSTFAGFDSHAASIELARRRAREAGVADRVSFDVAPATDFPGAGYDLIAHFGCFHAFEDPAGAARHARRAIAPGGTWLLVEPFAGDRPEHNHNPVGRLYYATSTMVDVPHSLSRGGPALGAQVGETRLREEVLAGGWSTLRRAAETSFHLVLEARP